MTRREFLGATIDGILMCAAGLPVLALAQGADPFPSRPMKLIIGSTPGASMDVVARSVAEILSRGFGQPAVVENQPGANGTIAVRNVLRAKPDGYTLLLYYSDQMIVAPLVYKDQPFDPVEDFVHITSVTRSSGFIVAVPPTSPATTFDEFVQLAKTSKKQLSYGTWGTGTSAQLGFELLNERYGVQMVHVPYKGAAASYQAAMAGEIDVVIGTSFVELLKSGRLRPLAISGNQRSTQFPNLPTFAELGLSETIFPPIFHGVAAPRGTPAEIVEKLRSMIVKGVRSPQFLSRVDAIAHEPYLMSSTEVIAAIRKAMDSYRPIVQKLGI